MGQGWWTVRTDPFGTNVAFVVAAICVKITIVVGIVLASAAVVFPFASASIVVATTGIIIVVAAAVVVDFAF